MDRALALYARLSLAASDALSRRAARPLPAQRRTVRDLPRRIARPAGDAGTGILRSHPRPPDLSTGRRVDRSESGDRPRARTSDRLPGFYRRAARRAAWREGLCGQPARLQPRPRHWTPA